MKHSIRLSALVLAALFACRAPEPERANPTATTTAPERTAAPKPQPAAPVAPTPHLAQRALELAHHGQPIDSIELLLLELPQRLAAQPWSDAALVDDSVVAAQALETALERHGLWSRALESLEAAKPFPASTPPELAAQLDLVLARALVRAGRVDEALQLTRAGGALIDWRIVGPFANERGGGFDTTYEPEKGLDFSASMRGKDRDVMWRANPTPRQPLANVVLHDMLRPNTQSTAYLATAISVDQPRDVVLAWGSSGAVKIWHGSTQIAATKTNRPHHRDQQRVALALQPGWNTILVKVGVEDRTGWLFTARLTELDGRPLTAFAQDSSQAPAARREVTASTAALAPSLRERLERTIEQGGEPQVMARAHRLLALHHLYTHPDDIAAHTAKKHAEAALALAPDDVFTLYLVARANEPEPGETIEEIRHNERLAPLHRVIELDPRHVAALNDLAEFHRSLNPIPRLADEYTRRALELAPEHYATLGLRASVLEQAGRDAESERLYELARESREGLWIADAITARALWTNWRGSPEAELEQLRDAKRRGAGERAVFDALINVHARSGDAAAITPLMNEWLGRAPSDVDFMLRIGRVLEDCDAVSEARGVFERARAVCPDNAQVAFALSRIAQRENDLEQADHWLAEVIRLDPGYDKARRQRQVLMEQSQERFENPYRWDAVERIGDARGPTDANEQVSVVDRTTVWRVNSDGSEHMYEHLLLRVENTGGVKELDTYWIGYPNDASLQVYNVRTIKPDGRFERAPPPRGRDQGWGGWNSRYFDLPPIQVGDFVDIEYRVDEKRPDVFGQYFGVRHSFYADHPDSLAPVARAELIVLAPRDVPLYFKAHNGAGLEHSIEDVEGDLRAYRWIARDLERPTPQAAMPDRIEYAPIVDISTYESWEAFASWWWNFIEKEFVTTPAMKEKVKELTAGLTDEMDKVRAIARFVGQEIRYNAWSFGTHGYEPFSAATIFERRFGDCKDKSILLRQMLAEIGVESHPVLINAQHRRPDEKLDVAMVGHFNHCIAYVPPTDERPGFYLDATADRNPIEYLREDDQGAKVLHVDDAHGSIHAIDYTEADENAAKRRYEVALESDGSADVRLVDESTGSWGVGLRYRFGGEQGDLPKRAAESLADSFGKVDIAQVETSKLEDIGAPARFEARFEATNLMARDGAGSHLKLGFDEIPLLNVAREPAAEREWEVVLDRPFSMDTTIVYRIPEGMEIGGLPPDATIEAPGFVEYSLTTKRIEGGVEVQRRFALLDRRVPVERYADFQDALREIQNAENRTIVLRAGPVEASSKENK